MKISHKWIIMAGLLLAAFISYGYGFSQGVVIFVVLGVTLEITFWFGVFGKTQRSEKLDDIEYDFGLTGNEDKELYLLLNEACHAYYHAKGTWVSEDKDSYSKALLKYLIKYPELESRLIRSKERVIKMITFRALEFK